MVSVFNVVLCEHKAFRSGTRLRIFAMQQLPNELWAEIFSFLDVPALTVASHVDRHRRAIAFDQPQFWRDIDISRPSPSIIHWAELRIHAGADRPFSLAINVPEQHPLVECLLRLISLSLHRMRSLRLCISGIYFPLLCDLLYAPAPLLAHLRLDVSADGRVSTDIPLPTSIFRGASPLLRGVELDSVTLPIGAVPAFQSVELVRVAVPEDAWHEFPPQLFDIFPAVRSLYMYGGGLLIKEPLTPSASAAFAQLDFLDVGYYETENIVFYRQLPTASIREIVASHSDKDTVRAAVAQLDGPIYMVFAKVNPDIRVIFSSVTSGKARGFVAEYSDFEGERYNSAFILGDPGFLERLVALRVALSLWSTVCHTVPSSNRITTLILYVDDDPSGIRLPSARLHCPEIRTLELRASGPLIAVDADDLQPFCDRKADPGFLAIFRGRPTNAGSRHTTPETMGKVTRNIFRVYKSISRVINDAYSAQNIVIFSARSRGIRDTGSSLEIQEHLPFG